MLIYLFVDVLILLFGFLTYKKTRKTWAVVLSLLLLVILAAIRGAFTSDYSNYLAYFLKVRRQVTLSEIFNPTVSFSMEKAFVLLSKLIGFLSDSPIVFFGIVSLLTLLAYWRGFLEFSPMPMLSILLFVSVGDYYAGYNLTRQILAAALVFFALTFWNKKQYLPFFFFLLVATSFHRTALILFPLVFLLNLRICKKNFFLLCACGALAGFALPYFVTLAQTLFPIYNDYSYGFHAGTINAVIPQLGMLFFVWLSIVLGKCNFDVNERTNRILINCCILATILLFIGLRIYITSRLAYYFKPAFCVLIPRVVASYKSEQDRRFVLLCIAFFAVAYTWVSLSGTGYDPYYTLFADPLR